MAKGSQLLQLKSALSQAGISKQPQNGKKRKRSVLDEKEKERKAAQLRHIQEKMNPFDMKVTKLKHDVGGRRIAGTMGRPAQSKQAGIERVRVYQVHLTYMTLTRAIYRESKRYSRNTTNEIAPVELSIDVLERATLP